MSYNLSQRSLDKLAGVDERMANVVKRAIEITKVDFGVTEGLRTTERQAQLVAAGKSQTMASKHIEGTAVDLVVYLGGDVCWELNMYDDIADAMKQAAIELNVPIRWGCAWNVEDIRLWRGTMEEAMMHYIDTRRKENKRPFLDGPHFEISS